METCEREKCVGVRETDARRDTRWTQAELGDIVYVELPEVGSKVEAKSSFGVVESVKAASDVYSPISGEVIAVNESLNDTPGMVNESAYGDGWLMKVKMSNKAELDSMMDAAAYEASWYVIASVVVANRSKRTRERTLTMCTSARRDRPVVDLETDLGEFARSRSQPINSQTRTVASDTSPFAGGLVD